MVPRVAASRFHRDKVPCETPTSLARLHALIAPGMLSFWTIRCLKFSEYCIDPRCPSPPPDDHVRPCRMTSPPRGRPRARGPRETRSPTSLLRCRDRSGGLPPPSSRGDIYPDTGGPLPMCQLEALLTDTFAQRGRHVPRQCQLEARVGCSLLIGVRARECLRTSRAPAGGRARRLPGWTRRGPHPRWSRWWRCRRRRPGSSCRLPLRYRPGRPA